MTSSVFKKMKGLAKFFIRPLVRLFLSNPRVKCLVLKTLKLFPSLERRLHDFVMYEGIMELSQPVSKEISGSFKQELVNSCSTEITGARFWNSPIAMSLKDSYPGHIDYGLVRLVRSSEDLDEIFSLSDDIEDCVIIIFLAFLRRYPREDDVRNFVTFIRGEQKFDGVRKLLCKTEEYGIRGVKSIP